MSSVAHLIATALRSGTLTHPGNPQTNQPPTTIPLMAFRATGMAPELAQHIDASTTLIAEAITALIEADHTIIPTAELNQLRDEARDGPPPETVTLHCRRCDTARQNPLAHIDIRGPKTLIDGKILIAGLSQRNPDCPHELK